MATATVLLGPTDTAWQLPPGVTRILEIEGGGGGGGPRGGISLSTGSGGGGSGTVSKANTSIAGIVFDENEWIDLSIAAAVGPGTYNSATSFPGQDTTVTRRKTSVVLVKALGGLVGTGRTGGAAQTTTGAVGDVLTPGNAGSSAGTTTGSDGGVGGNGPGSQGGSGGVGGTTTGSTIPGGDGGRGAGGGGGRGNNTTAGVPGKGGPGWVLITYLLPEVWS